MTPTTNPIVVEIARSLGVEPHKIMAGGGAELFVIDHPWTNFSDEAYLIADVMCAVIERLAPMLATKDQP